MYLIISNSFHILTFNTITQSNKFINISWRKARTIVKGKTKSPSEFSTEVKISVIYDYVQSSNT